MDVIYLVVHCSESPKGRDDSAADIHRWHKQRGWDGIGYHKVIRRDGSKENGRPEFWVGAHVQGSNTVSLGVCLIGTAHFTKEQYQSLYEVMMDWTTRYPYAHVVGHYDKDKGKTCPNFDVVKWWQQAKDNEGVV